MGGGEREMLALIVAALSIVIWTIRLEKIQTFREIHVDSGHFYSAAVHILKKTFFNTPDEKSLAILALG